MLPDAHVRRPHMLHVPTTLSAHSWILYLSLSLLLLAHTHPHACTHGTARFPLFLARSLVKAKTLGAVASLIHLARGGKKGRRREKHEETPRIFSLPNSPPFFVHTLDLFPSFVIRAMMGLFEICFASFCALLVCFHRRAVIEFIQAVIFIAGNLFYKVSV